MKQEFDQIIENKSPSTPSEKTDKSLSSIFGTEPMDVSVIDVSGAPDSIDADAEFVRSNMYGLMQQGNDALQYALDLAKQSDSPRAFEVVGTLMKNLSDMNLQLLDSHEKKAKLKNTIKKEEGPAKIVNNSIVFQGSTAELSKMLADMRKSNE